MMTDNELLDALGNLWCEEHSCFCPFDEALQLVADFRIASEQRGQPEATRETQRAEPGSAVNGTKVHTPKCGQDEV